MEFHFVNQTPWRQSGAADKRARQAVRSYVMKGKNAHRVLPDRKKQARNTISAKKQSKPATTPEDMILSLRRLVGDDISTYAPGIRWSPHTRLLIHQFMHIVAGALYPEDLCQPYELLKSIWFESLFTNEAYFHAVLGLTVTCVDVFLGCEESTSSLPHISRAYKLVNEKLRGEDALAETTMALICMLTIREVLREDTEATESHLNGLQRIVGLRGGLSSLESSPELLQKICRCDIELSLHTGTAPRFSYNKMPRDTLAQPEFSDFHDNLLVMMFSGSYPCMSSIIVDILGMTTFFNAPGIAAKLPVNDYQGLVITLFYRLKSFDCHDEIGFDTYQRACHLGLMAFIAGFSFQFGRRHAGYKDLSRRFRLSLERLGTVKSPSALLLWLLLIGNFSLWADTAGAGWVLSALATSGRAAGASTWEEVSGHIRNLPWINSVHDAASRRVWEKSQRFQAEAEATHSNA